MLLLSRKQNEKITIMIPGMESIELTIVTTGNIKTVIGIEAPRKYEILRNEIIGTPSAEPPSDALVRDLCRNLSLMRQD